MINEQLIEMLRCPLDQSPLAPAVPELVGQINRRISSGQVVNLAGQRVKKRIGGGLVRAAGDLLYPVVDDIPVMLPDEAIELSQLAEER